MTTESPLFFDLTSPSVSKFASTATIKSLIDVAGVDVCASRRNTQVSYNFLELANSLWTEINSLIEAVDKHADCDWGAYLKYTAAIDPLEKYDSSCKTLSGDSLPPLRIIEFC